MSQPATSSHQPAESDASVGGQSGVLPLVDRFGRVHRSLRISVTDVCNIRCQYCMPEEGAQFLAKEKLISFEQIKSMVQAVTPLGIRRLRITGGEPLLRPRLAELIRSLSEFSDIEDLALTTNGILLKDQLPGLVDAGLKRVNISLDTLSEEVFHRISRRNGLAKVMDGIEAAREADVEVKLNALVLRDVNLSGVLELVEFSSSRGLDLRFIEFMPLDAEKNWTRDRVVTGQELRENIQANFAPLRELHSSDKARPSKDYEFVGHPGRVGFIDTVSAPFCGNCDRLRLTADGKIRNCLFGAEEWDLKSVLDGKHTLQVQQIIRDSVAAKHPSHGIASPTFEPPRRAMYQIGG